MQTSAAWPGSRASGKDGHGMKAGGSSRVDGSLRAQDGPSEASFPERDRSAGDLAAAKAQARARELIAQAAETMRSQFDQARRGNSIDLAAARRVVDEMATSLSADPHTLTNLVRLKSPQDYTVLHSVAVCVLMVGLARQLQLPEGLVREAALGGLLHDIGKAFVPQATLDRQGELGEDELLNIRTHPELGQALLRRSGDISADALDICLHHHERMDGSGYPHRLRHGEISLLAKMGAVCDVYDAITSERPYKAGWDPGEALRVMAQWTGRFDDAVFQALVQTLGVYPVGSLVRLRSGRLAMVVAQNAKAPTAPRVKAFYCTRANEHLAPQTVDLARPGCQDRIVGCESPRTRPFGPLDELWLLG